MTLGLISCTKRKRNVPCQAREMYQPSTLFNMAYSYATHHYDSVAILSAKHGLILPTEQIEPYDTSLNSMRESERIRWAENVICQLAGKLPDGLANRKVFFHAGINYRRHLMPLLESKGITCHVPLQGLGIGQQMAWYHTHR